MTKTNVQVADSPFFEWADAGGSETAGIRRVAFNPPTKHTVAQSPPPLAAYAGLFSRRLRFNRLCASASHNRTTGTPSYIHRCYSETPCLAT